MSKGETCKRSLAAREWVRRANKRGAEARRLSASARASLYSVNRYVVSSFTCASGRRGGLASRAASPRTAARARSRAGYRRSWARPPGSSRQVDQPIRVRGERVPALRFSDARVQALLSVLLLFIFLPRGFSNGDLREHLAPMLGLALSAMTPGRMSYDLRRLRLHGLIERIPKTHRYQLTVDGRRIALFFTRVYNRVLRPGLAQITPVAPAENLALRASFDKVESAIDRWCDLGRIGRPFCVRRGLGHPSAPASATRPPHRRRGAFHRAARPDRANRRPEVPVPDTLAPCARRRASRCRASRCRASRCRARLRGVEVEALLPGRVACPCARQRLRWHAEVGQNLLHDARLGDGRQHAHLGRASGASKHVDLLVMMRSKGRAC
jgi:hypothetical protein